MAKPRNSDSKPRPKGATGQSNPQQQPQAVSSNLADRIGGGGGAKKTKTPSIFNRVAQPTQSSQAKQAINTKQQPKQSEKASSIDRFNELIRRDKANAKTKAKSKSTTQNVSKATASKESRISKPEPRRRDGAFGSTKKNNAPIAPTAPRALRAKQAKSGSNGHGRYRHTNNVPKPQPVQEPMSLSPAPAPEQPGPEPEPERKRLKIRGIGTPTTVRITHLDAETTSGDLREILNQFDLQVMSISLSPVYDSVEVKYSSALIVFKNREQAQVCVAQLNGVEADESGIPLVAEIIGTDMSPGHMDSPPPTGESSVRRVLNPDNNNSSGNGSVRFIKGRGFY